MDDRSNKKKDSRLKKAGKGLFSNHPAGELLAYAAADTDLLGNQFRNLGGEIGLEDPFGDDFDALTEGVNRLLHQI